MQSKRSSMVEAVANTVSGFVISVLLNWVLMPLYGLEIRFDQALSYTAIFMMVTTLRSYLWRRYFNHKETAHG